MAADLKHLPVPQNISERLSSLISCHAVFSLRKKILLWEQPQQLPERTGKAKDSNKSSY